MEGTWVRAILGSPVRMLCTGVAFLLLIVVGPLVLVIAGLWMIGVAVLVVGLCLLGFLVATLLPGRRSW